MSSDLKFKEQTFRIVDYSDLEDFIQKKLGIKEYQVAYDMEWSNDSHHEVNLLGKEELHDYDMARLEKFLAGESSGYMLRTIMQYLLNLGELEPGLYLINVCW